MKRRTHRTPAPCLAALLAAISLATGDAGATSPHDEGPTFSISELANGRTTIEWVSDTNWEEHADVVGDGVLVSLPLERADYTHVLVLGPGVDIEPILQDIEDAERNEKGKAGPLIELDLNGGIVFEDGRLRESEENLPRGKRDDETRERGGDGSVPPEERDPENQDVASPEKPPKLYGEEIDEEDEIELSFKFFAGDAKKKSAKARIRAARKYYEKAFAWWADQINDACDFRVAFEDLGNDTETLTHMVPLEGKKLRDAKRQNKPTSKRVGYRNYTTREEWAEAPTNTWLIGKELRNRLLRSPTPRTRFHLAVFRVNGIAFLNQGRKRNVEHVLYRPGIGIIRKPVQDRQKTAIHEVGHFLGLKDGDGKIMTYAKKANRRGGSLYGAKKFDERWCPVIKGSIQGAA